MHVPVIGFIPPVEGVENEFNTFRLGGKMAKVLKEGDEVFLMDEKDKVVFGRAQVLRVEDGPLGELCLVHAAKNHREILHDAQDAPARLYAYLSRIYGPHIISPSKKACVVYLRRIE